MLCCHRSRRAQRRRGLGHPDIAASVEAIQASTGAVVGIGDIADVMHQINDLQNWIAAAIEEQSVTTNEISRAVGEAATGAGQIANEVW